MPDISLFHMHTYLWSTIARNGFVMNSCVRCDIIMKMNGVLHVIAFQKIGMVPSYIFT